MVGMRRFLRGSAALFKADIASQFRSWVLRGWLIALVLAETLRLTGSLVAGRANSVPASALLAISLDGFLFVWSTFIIVHCAGSVSLEADVVADGILSRACTRTQYIGAKLAARVVVVMGIYAMVAAVSSYAAWRYAGSDVTLATMWTGVGVVGMAVLLLVLLGVAFSVVFNNTIVSVVAVLLLWYVASSVFAFVGAPYLSPASLAQNLPQILKDPTTAQVLSARATRTSIALRFSRALDPKAAEDPARFGVECPAGTPLEPAAVTYERDARQVLLSGLTLPAGASALVTLRGLVDVGGTEVAGDPLRVEVPGGVGSPGRAPARPAAPAPLRVMWCDAGATSVRVGFSKVLRATEAEQAGSFTVESPVGWKQTPVSATLMPGGRVVVLGGLGLGAHVPVKVTVHGVRAGDGAALDPCASGAVCAGVATWKYLVGFGAPALLCVLVSLVWFDRRDL